MSFDDFKSHITKTISKMKAEGHVIGEDRPTPGSKPVRYWSLPESHEMASDVVEAEQAPEILAPDYEPSSVAFVLHKKPMSAAKILKEFANCAFEDDGPLGAFLDGIAAAERFHGIAE
jgi:hypothetical protein